MKTQTNKCKATLWPGLLALAAGAALLCPAGVAVADDLIISTFDTGISGINWQNFRTYASGHDEVWDSSQDADGNPNSGSMYLTLNWPLRSDPAWNQNWNDVQIAFGTSGQFNASDYIAFSVDVKVDVANSSPALDGTYGALELIVNNPWQNVAGWLPIKATNGWQRFQGYFSGIPSGTYSEAVIGFISNGGSSLTNTVSCWIDNVIFTAPVSVHTNRPALNISAAPAPGLTCVASQAGGTWQRQMIRTVNSNYSWNTATAASSTTTYSMTLGSFPSPSYSGFNAQMFLIPQSGISGSPSDNSIDWDCADAVALVVGVKPDGTGTATFQYKMNNPQSWSTAMAVTLSCASGPLGQWRLAFNNNTNVTLTAPDNTATNFTIPAADALRFADPLYVYFGTQPNDNANIGQSATLRRVTITGAAGSLDDDFVSSGTPGQPYALNTSLWAPHTADPSGVFITAPDAKYWITWPQPDAGFTNVYAAENLSSALGGDQWKSLPVAATGWLAVGSAGRLTVINQSTLNAAFGHTPTNCFFGLWHTNP